MRQHHPPQSNQSSMEDLIKAFIIKTDKRLDTNGSSIRKLGTALRNLERQVGKLANLLSENVPGTLPTNIERNLKETINILSLRNGKVLQDLLVAENNELMENQVKNEGEQKSDKYRKNEVRAEQEDDLKRKNKSEVPTRKKKEKQRNSVQKAKSERDIDFQAYSAISQNKLLQKCGDRGSFNIPYSLGSTKFSKSLCDSGASINLMTLSIFRKLEGQIGEIRSIHVSLQLADQTTIIPEGIVEDILVRVDKFMFPMDFITVNMEENIEVPLTLGRPFLATGRTILDIQERKLMLRVGEEKVNFQIKGSMGP
uniref:Uncharacterized protein n=1 Tax=Nicotiana tabacum TaxID=4097 RepID=A0A1S4AWK4_TOBAC|nr:PREDICTED: uncharacterized protein LOC107801994 [Nicotiana tabacum]